MGKKRKGLSASLRWQVFARDAFTCRYCGVQAGDDGVILHADHLISVADGGTNAMDNLITACSRCNGGKGAKSLTSIPDASGVAERLADRAKSIHNQASQMSKVLKQKEALEQEAINLKCAAFDVSDVLMGKGESRLILNLCTEFGADTVLDWYRLAAIKRISESKAVQYVCGIARRVRERNAQYTSQTPNPSSTKPAKQ